MALVEFPSLILGIDQVVGALVLELDSILVLLVEVVDLAPVLAEVNQLVVCWYSVMPRLLLFPRFVVVLKWMTFFPIFKVFKFFRNILANRAQ